MLRRGLLVVVALVGLVGPASAAPAHVGVGWEPNRIERMDVAYEITVDGVLKVTETIDFQHVNGTGLLRRFHLRTPDEVDESMDRVLTVGNVTVESPTGGDTLVEQREYDPNENQDDSSFDSRELLLDILIDRNAEAGRATYVVRYELRGALEYVDGRIRFESPGPGEELNANAVTATIQAPQGVQSVSCKWFGTPCTSAKVVNGVAQLDNRTSKEKLEYSFGSIRHLSFTVDVPRDSVSGVGPVLDDPPWLKPNGMVVVAWVVYIGFLLGVVTVIGLITYFIVRAVRRRKAAASAR